MGHKTTSDVTNFYLHSKVLIFLRNDSDCKDVDLYNTRKRYAVIKSLDLMRNISWLASCFSKIKNPISIVQEIKVWLPVFAFCLDFLYLSLSNILIWTSTCGSAGYKRNIQNRKIQSKRVVEVTWPFRRAHRFIIIFDLILGKTSFLLHFWIARSCCLNGSAISNFP